MHRTYTRTSDVHTGRRVASATAEHRAWGLPWCGSPRSACSARRTCLRVSCSCRRRRSSEAPPLFPMIAGCRGNGGGGVGIVMLAITAQRPVSGRSFVRRVRARVGMDGSWMDRCTARKLLPRATACANRGRELRAYAHVTHRKARACARHMRSHGAGCHTLGRTNRDN